MDDFMATTGPSSASNADSAASKVATPQKQARKRASVAAHGFQAGTSPRHGPFFVPRNEKTSTSEISNPFPRGAIAAPPKSIAVLSRALTRRVFPRKFAKVRASKARSIAAIIFFTTFVYAFFVRSKVHKYRVGAKRRQGAEGVEAFHSGVDEVHHIAGRNSDRSQASSEQELLDRGQASSETIASSDRLKAPTSDDASAPEKDIHESYSSRGQISETDTTDGKQELDSEDEAKSDDEAQTPKRSDIQDGHNSREEQDKNSKPDGGLEGPRLEAQEEGGYPESFDRVQNVESIEAKPQTSTLSVDGESTHKERVKPDGSHISEISQDSHKRIQGTPHTEESNPSLTRKHQITNFGDAQGRLRDESSKDAKSPTYTKLHSHSLSHILKRASASHQGVHDTPAPKHSPRAQSSLRTHQDAAKGFQALLLQKSAMWDPPLQGRLKSKNPWVDLSGGRGAYGIPGRSAHIRNSVEMWAHKNVRASANFKFPFCRLFGACRAKSGAILLPKSFETFKDDLAKCGISKNSAFVLGDKELESAYEFVREIDGAKTAHMDLVERHPPRRGAAHFLADSLKLLFFIDVIHGSGSSRDGTVQRICFDSHGKRDGSCSVEKPSDVHPVMFIRKESFLDDPWVPHFMKLLSSRKTVKGRSAVRFLNQYSLYTASKSKGVEQAVCFRSISTSSYMYGQIPSSALTAQNPFFNGNNIDREPVSPIVPKATGAAQNVCRLRVKLSDQITGAASEQLNKVAIILKKHTAKPPKGAPQISLMLVLPAEEHVQFSKQVERMQSVDILVAPHGSAMNDMIFMRANTSTIELHPFSYFSGMFQGISHQLQLSYSRLSAEPDIRMIEACLRRFNKGPSSEGDIADFVALLESASREFSATGKTSIHTEAGSKSFPRISEIKQCSRKQRLRFDPQKLADEIWRVSERLCHKNQARNPRKVGNKNDLQHHE